MQRCARARVPRHAPARGVGGRQGRLRHEGAPAPECTRAILTPSPGAARASLQARKSPVVDGKVRRNARGKEERYPVILDAEEKQIARKVVLTFGQTVCGFDLLRSNGRSYVCDVNGWSFVKDSHKFWSDSANLLRQYALEAISPHHLRLHPEVRQPALASDSEEEAHERQPAYNKRSYESLSDSVQHYPVPPDAELLCVVALTRHGDRTPKEKLKLHTHEPLFLSMVEEYGRSPTDELKIKNVRLMEELTDRVVRVVARMEAARQQMDQLEASDDPDYIDDLEKLQTVKQVLKSHPFRGINRKVQLKPTKWERGPPAPGHPEGKPAVSEVLFILKWGGELTPLGEKQAEKLGTVFRKSLYPGEFGGVLRLHSTYRHDLKIYASEEGRVQMTAAAFAKGFLDLEGMLTPILASLVSKNDKVTQMLDETPDAGRTMMDAAKAHIHRVLTTDGPLESDTEAPEPLPGPFLPAKPRPARDSSGDLPVTPPGSAADGAPRQLPPISLSGVSDEVLTTEDDEDFDLAAQRSPLVAAAPTASSLLVRCLRDMGNPRRTLHRLRLLLEQLVSELRARAVRVSSVSHDKDMSPVLGNLHSYSPAAVQRVRSAALENRFLSAAAAAPAAAVSSHPSDVPAPANGETVHLQYCRWAKLKKDFYKAKKDKFDTTKIPDVYDNAMYDMVHNDHLGLEPLPEVYCVAHTLASYVVPQEYGIEKHDKVHIGLQIASVLLKKMRSDLLAATSSAEHEQERVHQLDSSHNTDVRTPQRHVRTRLYFTSESRIYAMFNVLRWGSEVSHMSGDTVPSIFSEEARRQFDDMELCYLTHVVFRVFHRKSERADVARSYSMQVLVSPGVNEELRRGRGASVPTEHVMAKPMILSSRDDLTLEDIDSFIGFFLRQGNERGDESASAGEAQGARALCSARGRPACNARACEASAASGSRARAPCTHSTPPDAAPVAESDAHRAAREAAEQSQYQLWSNSWYAISPHPGARSGGKDGKPRHGFAGFGPGASGGGTGTASSDQSVRCTPADKSNSGLTPPFSAHPPMVSPDLDHPQRPEQSVAPSRTAVEL